MDDTTIASWTPVIGISSASLWVVHHSQWSIAWSTKCCYRRMINPSAAPGLGNRWLRYKYIYIITIQYYFWKLGTHQEWFVSPNDFYRTNITRRFQVAQRSPWCWSSGNPEAPPGSEVPGWPSAIAPFTTVKSGHDFGWRINTRKQFLYQQKPLPPHGFWIGKTISYQANKQLITGYLSTGTPPIVCRIDEMRWAWGR